LQKFRPTLFNAGLFVMKFCNLKKSKNFS